MLSKAELIEQAETLGIKVDGRWGESRLREVVGSELGLSDVEILADNEASVYQTPLGEPLTREQAIEYVNERSMAQWSGQSPSLPVHERKRRIVRAMKEKGFDDLVEEIKWPV